MELFYRGSIRRSGYSMRRRCLLMGGVAGVLVITGARAGHTAGFGQHRVPSIVSTAKSNSLHRPRLVTTARTGLEHRSGEE